jgi:carbon-monoxide dehydrogenase medium subunit
LKKIEELNFIKEHSECIEIGAMTSHATVAESKTLDQLLPGLSSVAAGIADRHVRNRGTLGGSIANCDPAADYPAALLALGAVVQTTRRAIEADDFFVGLFTTALDEGEIIRSVTFPKGSKLSYVKYSNPASRYAIVGTAVAQSADSTKVAVTGAGNDGVFRWGEAEELLSIDFTSAAISAVQPDIEIMMGDIHASPKYRAALVQIMARRAVEKLIQGG